MQDGGSPLSILASGAKFPTAILVVLIVLILLSGFFSATETAFTSANKIRLKTLASNGNKRANAVLKMSEKYDRLISAILVGNNIVNLSASALATIFFMRILRDGANYALISTIVITVAVLIFGEITPKLIAKTYPEKFAMAVFPIMQFFLYLFYPLTAIFSGYKFLISKLFKTKPDDVITEEEIITYVEEAEEDGTFKEEETKLIRSAIEFDDLEVGDILVPRVNMARVNVTSTMEEIKDVFIKEGYSRLPVYQGTIDTIIGVIHEKDFFKAYVNGDKDISHILAKVPFTTEHIKISQLLKQLQGKKTHMAIVLDEYGGTLGLVTLEDILEELVGEIWDEHDEETNYFKRLNGFTFLVDGKASLEDAFEYFGLAPLENEEAVTVSGWVIETLGEIPIVGKKFEYKNLNIEVTKSSVRKVLEIKVIKNEKHRVKEEEN